MQQATVIFEPVNEVGDKLLKCCFIIEIGGLFVFVQDGFLHNDSNGALRVLKTICNVQCGVVMKLHSKKLLKTLTGEFFTGYFLTCLEW